MDMSPLVRRVVSRYTVRKDAKVRVVQRRVLHYETSFLQDVAERIVARTPGAHTINLLVNVQKNVRGEGSSHNLGKHEFNPSTGLHTIWVSSEFPSLEGFCESLAHELGHAVLTDSGRFRPTYHGGYWDGVLMENLPWAERPWEKEAIRHERYGLEVFQELKAGGLIPKTKGEHLNEEFERKNPQFAPKGIEALTMAELAALPEEEQARILEQLRAQRAR